MKYTIKKNFILATLLLCGLPGLHAEDPLKNDFQKPPASARPWVFYFVVGANMTKEGITADFEAMARVGIGGMVHMEVVHDAPKAKDTPDYASPQWIELIQHACKEAQRLGLKINMTNGPSWTGSSGAWITPALSMQKVVWTETMVEGGKPFAGRLEKPASVKNYYQDIAVLAFPTPTAEAVNMADAAPKITSSGTNPKPGQFTLERPEPNKVQHVQIEFAAPFTASAVAAKLSGPGWAAVSGELQVSDDGQSFQPVQAFAVHAPVMTVNFPRVTARFFRVVFSKNEDRKPTSLEVSNIDLNQRYRIEGVEGKASFDSWKMPSAPASWPVASADAVISRDRILDLSDKMDADGKLSYDFPAGSWTVLRFGHTITGRDNGPWPETARGLESDKFSKAASKAMFDGLMGRLVTANKDLTGQDKALVATHIDSWEIHSQNWTPLMREEFKQRRGYELLKFLPTFTGRVVDGVESTERFLWDFRQTVSDLIVDNYAGEMRRLANQHGLRLSIEAYDGPAADLPYGGQADEPMAEFWAWTKYRADYSCTEMSSAAHTYGKKILGAEAFTSEETEKWQGHPANIKDLGDWAFCEGINRFVFHRYAAQTWMQASPGIALGPWGLHYERTQTWWEQSKAWHEYLARCQYLLQQGLFVADVAYLQQEGAPYRFKIPAGAEIARHIRGGYNFDGCSPDVVLERMSVKNGRIVLPDGMSYAVLVVPEVETMTPKLLRKISQMVDQGALVIAANKPPQKSPSLTDLGAGDAEVKKLADALWSSGKIVTGKTAAEVLAARGVKSDFSATPILRYIHRTIGEAEVYFVANPEQKEMTATAAFRVTGKQPEFWWPDTGRTEQVNDFEIKDGLTRIPLRLDPSGSVFVIFRQVTKTTHGTGKNWVDTVPVQEMVGPWEVAFDPKWGGPISAEATAGKPATVTFKKLVDWSKRPEDGIKYYSGTARYKTVFNYTPSTSSAKTWLDLGKVAVMAEVTLNGKYLGILWKPPYRVEVTDAIQTGANTLEVKVVNLFINRQIGDEQLPEDSDRLLGGYYDGKAKSWPQWLQEGKPSPTGRFTFSSWRLWKKTDPLAESGLLGPVTIQATELIK